MRDIKELKTPEQLVAWVNDNNILINIEVIEAEKLLEYLNERDFRLGIGEQGLIMINNSEGKRATEETTLDDVIDQVTDWNFEMIQEVAKCMETAVHFNDYEKYEKLHEILCSDEKILNPLFSQTCQGKEIEELAQMYAEEFIDAFRNKGLGESVDALINRLSEYEEKERGR